MRLRRTAGVIAIAVAAMFLTASVGLGQGTGSRYLTPPQVIVDILDAAPPPLAVVSPARDTMALIERTSMPSIAELSRPMLRLAGARINPRTNGPHRTAGIVGITLKLVGDGSERKVAVPAGSSLGSVRFSPDGRRLAFTVTTDRGIELWIADVATGRAKATTTATLNGAWGDPCDWMNDTTLLCSFVPDGRGAPPAAPDVPSGPTVQETFGKPAPVRTYQDMLGNAHDEALFEHYFTRQLATVDAETGGRTVVGRPGLIGQASASPSDEFLLVARVKRPFSYLVPAGDFPREVEIWDRKGTVIRRIADLPLADTVPVNGVPTGPRRYRWQPTEPATLVWAEALDEGDPRRQVPYRDRIVALRAPFEGEPQEVARTEFRFMGISWTERGVGLLTENDRATRRTRTWLVAAGAAPRTLWDHGAEDRYNDPGSPVRRPRGAAAGGVAGFGFGERTDEVILQHGDAIYLTGQGASPQGDRPFLDRLNLQTLAVDRLFRSDERSYETVLALVTDDGQSVVTRYETRTDPPNYFLREIAGGRRQALTQFKDPAPQLAGVEKQLVTYARADGVKLSGTLYLPPDYKKGERLPVVMWAYPREFTDPSVAGQVTGSANRFTTIEGASHLLLLTQGYAIFDDPKMPIVGKGESANDTYVEQLVASAQAAVDTLVEMGVADRDRIGIGGHSYGAFMTANLLAHSDIFRAGVARSGAYNRTLTPFGFQNEIRTFWEARDIYARMSPFYDANQVNEPILLIHGEADNNSGTFPIQSERFYMALKGHGATVRYVTLPHEAHGYAARESVLHTVAEMLSWMDRHVKNAPPRKPTSTAGGSRD